MSQLTTCSSYLMKSDETWLKQIIDIMWGKRKTEKKAKAKQKISFFQKHLKLKGAWIFTS